MNGTGWIVGLLALFSVGVFGSPARAEIKTPRVGEISKYECTGEYGEETIFKVVRVEGGLIRREGTTDGKKAFVEEYLNGIGTSLFKTRDRADGQGVRGQRFNENDFKGYEQLEPGSKYSGNVREWTNRGPWWWSYEISIGEPKIIKHNVLGEIEIVPVTEIRGVKGQAYRSRLYTLVYPELGMELTFTYKDRRGTYKCDLVSLEPGVP